MSEFKVIESQEQLDTVIGERIKRERKTIEEKYEGYLSPEEAAAKYEGYLSPEAEKEKYKEYLSPEEAAKKDATIKEHEINSVKVKIANEIGIPYELAARLSGDNEEAIRKDAQTVSKLIGKNRTQPLRGTEPGTVDEKKAALKNTLAALKGE